jgi:acyl carrier protein
MHRIPFGSARTVRSARPDDRARMDSATVKLRLDRIFQDIFDDPSLQITESTTASDIDAWDSLTHIDLIVQVEKEFKIKLSTGEVRGLKNVGDFITLIAGKAT